MRPRPASASTARCRQFVPADGAGWLRSRRSGAAARRAQALRQPRRGARRLLHWTSQLELAALRGRARDQTSTSSPTSRAPRRRPRPPSSSASWTACMRRSRASSRTRRSRRGGGRGRLAACGIVARKDEATDLVRPAGRWRRRPRGLAQLATAMGPIEREAWPDFADALTQQVIAPRRRPNIRASQSGGRWKRACSGATG